MNVRALPVLPVVPGAMLIALLWSEPAPLAQSRRVDDAALKAAGAPGSSDEWLTYGLTQGETRFSPLKDINAANVGRLGLAWSLNIGPGGGGQEATPLF